MELKYMKYTLYPLKRKKLLLRLLIGIFTIFICFITSVYVASFLLGPPQMISDQNTIYYGSNGDVIGEEKGVESRYWVPIEDMPSNIIHAVTAVEDRNFLNHHGFDIKRIGRAILLNIQSFSLKEGASTLTQQYARNLFLSHEKTWTRKLTEAFYTIRLEMYYSKEEILEGYLNTIYFGHGAYGIEAASRHFFGKHVNDISLAEAAMLVGIPKGPTYYSPLNDLTRAIERQQMILNQLHEQQFISDTEFTQASQEELVYVKQDKSFTEKIGPYFQDVVLKEASEILQIDKDKIKSGGYQIYTTLQPDLQKQLEKTIKEHINTGTMLEVGALAIHPQTGAALALVGGRSYDESPFNRATDAKRMVGSTFKPFLYYAALNNGYTASTKLMSEPTVFTLENNETYQPRNFNGYYADEPITLTQALALSDNIYAVKTHLLLGTETLVDTAKEFGITSDLPLVPSLALGTASISVEEMTVAYGMLANGGRQLTRYTIEKIIDRHGNLIFTHDQKAGKQILDQANTFILTHLLMGMFDERLNGHMSVTGSSIINQLTRLYAGKSGTTDSDSWMIGYSPTLVTGIWTGYDDNRSMEIVQETTYAKNIWASFMEKAHDKEKVQNFSVPHSTGIIAVQVDPDSGQIATPYCPSTRTAYFKKGTQPTIHCQTHFPSDHQNQEQGILQRLFEILR